jgi:SagB-type dehydrogenase family enzyme
MQAGRRAVVKREMPRRAILSRFAFLRREGDRWLLESPMALARVELLAPTAFAMLEALRKPCSAKTLASAGGVPVATAKAMLESLNAAGFLTAAAESRGGPAREDRDDALAVWEFADLLLHSRSRAGRHDQPIGATYPFRATMPPAPATRTRPLGTRVSLPTPTPEALSHDASFTSVLERRESAREFSDRPIGIRELGEFLFRAAGIREMHAHPDAPYDTTRRPYPSGGACYPLEIYLATDRCGGLRAGLHHYDPAAHVLTTMPRSARGASRLLAEARAAVRADAPTVLVILTARFQRVAWKYRSISYATILKDVGGLLQTMYLVATAMGLPGSAVGCGNVSILADTLGVDFQRESSVGEFLIGAPGAK